MSSIEIESARARERHLEVYLTDGSPMRKHSDDDVIAGIQG
jgi:hypothetical protein